MNPLALLPELCLLVGALAVLLGGSFLPLRRLGRTRLVTLAALAAAALTAVLSLGDPAHTVFDGSYAIDPATSAARLIVVVATAMVVLLAAEEVRGLHREAEIYVLLLLAALGAVVLAGANDLLVVITGFLLASIPLYALVGMARAEAAPEAAMKTYFYGSLFGIVLMGGVIVLYGVAGTTSYTDLTQRLGTAPAGAVAFATVAVLGGLMFKAGGVPGHFWVPDAAQGTSALAATFLTTVPKVGALVASYRLVVAVADRVDALALVGALATLSMTLGNLAAYAQTDPRRLLGWSTVSQVGYLLVPVAVAGRNDLALPSLLVYLAGYAVTNIAAFAVVAALPERRTIASYTGLARTHPWLAAALLVSLLGLVGTPPTVVFVGKLGAASAAWDGGAPWLAAVLMINSALSLFYYLRWIFPAYLAAEPDLVADKPQTWGRRTAITAAAASVALGVLAGGVWRLVAGATTT